jgi:hypothetical protein
MSLDFQSIREQVKQLGENALNHVQEIQKKRDLALELLAENAQDVAKFRQKIESTIRDYDPGLRCGLPVSEGLNLGIQLPNLESQVSILAADGSQITPDRNAEVNFAVINVGAIQMRKGDTEAPITTTESRLLYDEQLYTPTGTVTDAKLALMRDLEERTILAKLAEEAVPPIVTFTDGPMELWIDVVAGQDSVETTEMLEAYMSSLTRLQELEAITAGYIDKPGTRLVVRSLEVMMTPEAKLPDIKNIHPLRGITDIGLYKEILGTGERSAVFALRSQPAKSYKGSLGLHFFYLNVSQSERPYLARVDIPAWVAEDAESLDILHATLVDQCRVMGVRPYPYLLHRAHETAVVRLQEREQVTMMIAQELRERGLTVGERSSKQFAKQAGGRGRYEG